MRIIFIGSVYFSGRMLEKLIQLNAEVVGVITKEKSYFNTDFEDLSPIARNNNLPSIYVKDINSEQSVNWIKVLAPDILFCFGWSNLIKKELLKIPRMGVIGFHPSLLPKNRGRHPLIWAKVLGLKKSGTTFFFMDEGADTGEILDQKEFAIDFEDDASSLYKKMLKNASEQIEFFLPQLQSGSFPSIKQVEEGNYWRKRNAIDGLVDFRMTSEGICNLVRALSYPYPGAHCFYNGEEVKIWEVELENVNPPNIEPGKILDVQQEEIKVKTFNGLIILKRHSFSKKPKIGEYLQ